MSEWKDTTSYSQNTKREDRVPKTWELRLKHLRIKVHRYHSIDDVWFLTCHDINISVRELASKELEQAKCQAKAIVQATLEHMLEELIEIGGSDGK
jgi:hypothetical protein